MSAETIKVKICASGLAKSGLRAIEEVKMFIDNLEWRNDHQDIKDSFEDINIYRAEAAIRGIYDGFLSVLNGDCTIDQMKDFFFNGQNMDEEQYLGGVISFHEKEDQNDKS